MCLGVSLLYLAIAQRLDLPLQPITPPGHIYLRYEGKDGKIINIETTQRGVHAPSESYLGIETRALQKRTYREAIGLGLMNQASVLWEAKDYKTACLLYEKATLFIKDDALLQELLGYCYLFTGKRKEGIKLLMLSQEKLPDHAVSKSSIVEDYLSKRTDEEGIKTVFMHVDETRNSILHKQKKLESVVKKFPTFRAGLLQLAGTHLQLSELKKAEEYLQRYHDLSPQEPLINYYLAMLSIESYDFNQAWYHLKKLKETLALFNHEPKALKDLVRAMKEAYPTCKEL